MLEGAADGKVVWSHPRRALNLRMPFFVRFNHNRWIIGSYHHILQVPRFEDQETKPRLVYCHE